MGKKFGNPVIDPDLYKIDWTKVRIQKRSLIVPSENDKEPSSLFKWIDCGEVEKIVERKQLLLKFKYQHSLKTGNVIAFSTSLPAEENCWIMNNHIAETSSRNNMLFKVEVLNDK